MRPLTGAHFLFASDTRCWGIVCFNTQGRTDLVGNIFKISAFTMKLRLLCVFTALSLSAVTESHAEKFDLPKLKKDIVEKWEEDGKMFADLKLFIVGSQLVGSSGVPGAEAEAVLAPTVKIMDQLHLVGLYSGSYARKKQVYIEDRGNWLSTESMTHNFTPSLRYKHRKDLSFNISIFKTLNLSKETLDEQWYNGLYDYQDIGIGIDTTYKVDAEGTLGRAANLRLQYYSREYPQYISLFTLADLGNIEEKEKDHKGLLLLGRISEKKTAILSYSYELSILSKSYTDKKIETITWERESESQKDTTLTHTGTVSTVRPDGIIYGLNASYTVNTSNQNLAQGSITSGIFHRDYYSYTSIQVSPSMRFRYQHLDFKPVKVSVQYSVSKTHYANRLAKDTAGLLTGNRQEDTSHAFSTVVIYPLKEHLTAGAGFEFLRSNSNNDYETFYRYDYEILNFSAGIMYHY